MKTKIVIIGLGYVGSSLAVLLAQNHNVIGVDTDLYKVKLLNQKKSPVKDKDISQFLKNKELNLIASNRIDTSIKGANFIIISTPTSFSESKGSFDTSSVEEILSFLNIKKSDSIIVIKSTIPIGFTEKMKKIYKNLNIIFSPEFLREGSALFDNLYPSRIIVGGDSVSSNKFANILSSASLKNDTAIMLVNPSEAEAIKLFSNTYLAMRVSFFNELDTFANEKNLSSKSIIDGLSLDERIGDHYNNPSFGFGGYCLPKDVLQLRADYNDIPQKIISSISSSNQARGHYIANKIIKKMPSCVGIYRLVMKNNSDNFRDSSILTVLNVLKKKNIKLVIFEPLIKQTEYQSVTIENDIEKFKKISDLIVTNRMSSELNDVDDKLFTRDVFGIN